MSDIDQRLIDLEERVAHYERLAEELSDVLTAQARQIDLLTLQVRRLKERVADAEAGSWDRSPQDDRPPPHY